MAQAVSAMRCGVLSAVPEVDRIGAPLADNGGATVDAVVDALDGRGIVVQVEGRLRRPTA